MSRLGNLSRPGWLVIGAAGALILAPSAAMATATGLSELTGPGGQRAAVTDAGQLATAQAAPSSEHIAPAVTGARVQRLAVRAQCRRRVFRQHDDSLTSRARLPGAARSTTVTDLASGPLLAYSEPLTLSSPPLALRETLFTWSPL
jgi:hypothetical protein